MKSYLVDTDLISVPAAKRVVNKCLNTTNRWMTISPRYKTPRGSRSIFKILEDATVDMRLYEDIKGFARFNIK
jgi:hypothetical protein